MPVVIVDTNFRGFRDTFSPEAEARLKEMAEVVWGEDAPIPKDVFEDALPRAAAILTGDWRRYDFDFLQRAANLKAIIHVGGSFTPGLDYGTCFARSIRVLSVSPTFAQPVAEMALGMAIAAGREITQRDRELREARESWKRQDESRRTSTLFGQTVGFVGFGAIARQLRLLLEPFGCRILAYDPWLPDTIIEKQGAEPTPLHPLLEASQTVFVLASPTSDNKALLGREELELMKEQASLILISRAHLVDFDALTEMVLAGRLKAGIDVYPAEPVPADHPIRRAELAVLTSHKAGSVWGTYQQIGHDSLDDLELILRGLPPQILLQAQPELIAKLCGI